MNTKPQDDSRYAQRAKWKVTLLHDDDEVVYYFYKSPFDPYEEIKVEAQDLAYDLAINGHVCSIVNIEYVGLI